jgi:hypothetical protein
LAFIHVLKPVLPGFFPFLGDTDPVPMLRREPSGVDVKIQSDGVMLRAKLPSRNTTGAVPGEQAAAGAKAGGGQGDGVLGLNSGFMCVRHQVASLYVTAMSCSNARSMRGSSWDYVSRLPHAVEAHIVASTYVHWSHFVICDDLHISDATPSPHPPLVKYQGLPLG